MNADRIETEPSAPDHFRSAEGVIRWSLAVGLIGAAVVLIGGGVRGRLSSDPRPSLQAILPAEKLAFEPAGRAGRAPASHPAVRPHYVPGLARLAPSPARLLIDSP